MKAERSGVPVEAVLFDLGGVVVGIDFSRVFAHWARASGSQAADLAARFAMDDGYTAHERGEIDFAGYCGHLRRGLSIDLDDAALLAGWNDIFIGVVPGIEDVFGEVLWRWPLYGFSNTNAVHHDVWSVRYAATLAPLRRMYCSHALGARKPDPAAFRLVAGDIGLDPASILFFDDTAENIVGAAAAGMQAYLIDPKGDVPAQVRAILDTVT